MNNSHLVVVNSDTFPIHIENSFCGFVKAGGIGYFGQFADLMSIRKGDLVFFYLNYIDKKYLLYPENDLMPGYYGICRVVSFPFLHEYDIRGAGEHSKQSIFGGNQSSDFKKFLASDKRPLVLPLRFKIELIKELCYTRAVDDNLAYVDKTDEGQLWTLLFKKINKAGQQRGVTPLLPEEASKIARLLFKVNLKDSDERIQKLWTSSKPYSYEVKEEHLLNVDLEGREDDETSVRYENMLVAYIMKNIDHKLSGLERVIGKLDDLEFFGNHIQYGISGDTVDILLLHKKKISDNTEFRYKATVIEVKRDRIVTKDIEQALRYATWIAQLVTFNNIGAIQPVVIGKKPAMPSKILEMKDRIAKLESIGIKKPILVDYERERSGITFREFELA
jgi:hypothetical protein